MSISLFDKPSNKGFTLIEVLVAATIIGVLFGVASISYSSLTKSSRDGKRRADLEQIRAGLEMYRSNDTNGEYPTAGSCTALATAISAYLPTFPADPKSSTYSYVCSSSTTDYTIGAYLEATTSTCTSVSGCSSSGCNYCAGPYGQKQ